MLASSLSTDRKLSASELPVDVLIEIFESVANSTPGNNHRRDNTQWLLVAAVCKNWRETCLQHAQLWTYINPLVWSREKIRTFIERSKEAQLTLDYTDRDYFTTLSEYRTPVGPDALLRIEDGINCIERVGELHVRTRHRYEVISRLLCALTRSGEAKAASVLTIIDIRNGKEPLTDILKILASGSLPALTNLALDSKSLGFVIKPGMESVLENLTQLRLTVTIPSSIMSILRICKDRLELLKLRGQLQAAPHELILRETMKFRRLQCFSVVSPMIALHRLLVAIELPPTCRYVRIYPTDFNHDSEVSLMPRLDFPFTNCSLSLQLSDKQHILRCQITSSLSHQGPDALDWKIYAPAFYGPEHFRRQAFSMVLTRLQDIAQTDTVRICIQSSLFSLGEDLALSYHSSVLENLTRYKHITVLLDPSHADADADDDDDEEDETPEGCGRLFLSSLLPQEQAFDGLEKLSFAIRELQDEIFLDNLKSYLQHRIDRGKRLGSLCFLQQDLETPDMNTGIILDHSLAVDTLRELVDHFEVVTADKEF